MNKKLLGGLVLIDEGVMKRLIALIILLLTISSTCYAFRIPDDKNRWLYLYKNGPESVYLDTHNYQSFYGSYIDKAKRTHKNHYIVSTWLWKTEPNKPVDYHIDRVVYDLTCNMYGLARVIEYNRNGEVISDIHLAALGEEAVPNSVGELELESIQLYDKYKDAVNEALKQL